MLALSNEADFTGSRLGGVTCPAKCKVPPFFGVADRSGLLLVQPNWATAGAAVPAAAGEPAGAAVAARVAEAAAAGVAVLAAAVLGAAALGAALAARVGAVVVATTLLLLLLLLQPTPQRARPLTPSAAPCSRPRRPMRRPYTGLKR